MALKDKGGFLADTSQWEKMKKNLMKGSHLAVKVGFFDSYYGPENDNLSVAQVAQWNEDGMGIPMRSFIRNGFLAKIQADNPDWLTPRVLNLINEVALGTKTWTSLYESLGIVFVQMMKKEIIDFNSPGNAPLTIFLKGEDNPLIDTGLMLNSVEYQLGRKSLGG